MAAHQVRALLMGGQACVFYGAAEFSRDIDLAVLADPENIERLRQALNELQAEPVYVPELSEKHLRRGHAVHFRCQQPETRNLRIDIMSSLRGVDPFPVLWSRRVTVTDQDGLAYELLSLPDLVKAKKTQRDKDWPMIRRLLEADYSAAGMKAGEPRFRFWLLELRTPELLIRVAEQQPRLCAELINQRHLLAFALEKRMDALPAALEQEEKREREADRVYWQPLKAELEQMRHRQSSAGGP